MKDAELQVSGKAKIKHTVLFVIACVTLAISLLLSFAILLTRAQPPVWEDPTEEYGAIGLFAVALAGAGYALAQIILLFLFALHWGVGQVFSALLAMEKADKPRWLWRASFVLALAHLTLLAAMIAIWLLL